MMLDSHGLALQQKLFKDAKSQPNLMWIEGAASLQGTLMLLTNHVKSEVTLYFFRLIIHVIHLRHAAYFGPLFASGSSTTAASVVVNKTETLPSKLQSCQKLWRATEKWSHQHMELHLAASTKAVLTTFKGSIIPASTMSTYSPVAVSKMSVFTSISNN